MLINLLKSPIPQWQGKWKSDSECVPRTRSPPKVLPTGIDKITTPSFNEIGGLLIAVIVFCSLEATPEATLAHDNFLAVTRVSFVFLCGVLAVF